MYTDFQNQLLSKLAAINDAGFFNECGTIMSGEAVINSGNGSLLNFRNPYPFQVNICPSEQLVKNASASSLEKKIARLLNAEGCILYNSPADASCALANHLLERTDALIYNSLGQFAINGGPTFCRPTKYKYHGFDILDIEKQLKLAQAQQNRLLIIDAVDIATGNIAPMNSIFELAAKYNAIVAIDQTLSAGIIGNGGSGICTLFDTDSTAEIQIGSLQNLGSNTGAYIAGRREIIDLLRQRTSNILPSAPMTPSDIAAADATIDAITGMNTERQYILQITNYFIKKLYCLGLEIPPTLSYRFAVMVGDSSTTENIAETLARKGVLVTALTTPHVSKDQCRLIITLSASHTKDDIEKAAVAFESVLQLFHKS